MVGRALGDRSPKALAPVFQALRIWVNDEARDLDAALAWLPGAMAVDGVVVTIAYPSGEDRRVKHALRAEPALAPRRLPPSLSAAALPASPWTPLVRKVVVPSQEEQLANPRARSARLRAFRRNPR